MGIQMNNVNFEYLVDGRDELKSITGSTSLLDSTRKKTGTGWFVSAFLVVNAALGAGLLNLPAAYHQAGGVLTAVIVQSVLLVFVVLTLLIIVYCSDIKASNTYQDVVLSLCGPKAQLACAVCVSLFCFGMCITLLIIIGDQWEIFFLRVSHDHYCTTKPFYMTRAFTISLTSIVFILPLCFPKRIDFLKYTSVLGVIGILYVAGLIAVKFVLPHHIPESVATRPRSWINVFYVVPQICFAYQCHISSIPIYSCMAKRNIREFSKTVTLAMILCVLIYTVTAALGYLQFGDSITADILLSFNPTAEVMVAVVLVAVKTYTTYPILCYCGKAALNTIWRILRKTNPDEISYGENLRHIITTLLWFTLTVLLSIYTPNIGVVIEILGSLAAVFIFVFPGLCLLRTMQNRVESREQEAATDLVFRGTALVLIVVGVFIFGLTLSQAIMQDIRGVQPDSSKFNCR